MNKSEKIQAIEELQNVLDLLKDRSEALEIQLKAKEAVNVVDMKLGAVRSSLRGLVNEHGVLHVDMDGTIYKICKKMYPDNFADPVNDVTIEEIHIACQRITAKT